MARKNPFRGNPVLLVALGVSTVIVVVVMAFLFHIVGMGRAISDNSTAALQSKEAAASQHAQESKSATEESTPSPEEAIQALASNPSCKNVNDDAIVIRAWVNDSTSPESAVMDAVKAISQACGNEYALQLRHTLSEAQLPEALASSLANNSWLTKFRPAPSGAVTAQDFTSRLKNISCAFADDKVSCTIMKYDFTPPAGCTGKPVTVTMDVTGKAEITCSEKITSTNVLDYNTSIENNGLACTVTESGVSCWSELLDHGFTLRRAENATF